MSANFPAERSDFVIGGGHKPGYRMRQHLDQNVVEELRVLAGQSIKLGDIVTLTGSGLAANFETGSTSSSYNTADLRNGAFQALNTVNNVGGADGDQLVTVVPPGGFAELYAAAGVEVGDWVEIDVKSDASTPAALTAQLARTTALTARQRVKEIADSKLQNVLGTTQAAGDETVINPEAYGVVGWVRKILTRTAHDGSLKSTTVAGDLVHVQLGRVRG